MDGGKIHKTSSIFSAFILLPLLNVYFALSLPYEVSSSSSSLEDFICLRAGGFENLTLDKKLNSLNSLQDVSLIKLSKFSKAFLSHKILVTAQKNI